MPNKKVYFLTVAFTLAFAFSGKSQIITSKKEALKKGVYQKPAEKKSEFPADSKSRLIAYTDTKTKEIKEVKDTKIVKPLPKPKKSIINDKDDKDLIIDPSENYIGLQMINNAMTFMGVRYHGGGTTTSGMDCSGMVTAVFNIFDIQIPRNSNEMSKIGEKLDIKDAQKGDLIFFRTNGRKAINHVGMVVEVLDDEIKFIHASTSSGVMVSSTKEAYYKRAFAQVNRVLNKS